MVGNEDRSNCLDQDGKEIISGKSGFGNILIDFEEALVHIMEAIDQCQKNVVKGHCVCICLGLAGISGTNTNELTLRLKQKYGVQLKF